MRLKKNRTLLLTICSTLATCGFVTGLCFISQQCYTFQNKAYTIKLNDDRYFNVSPSGILNGFIDKYTDQFFSANNYRTIIIPPNIVAIKDSAFFQSVSFGNSGKSVDGGITIIFNFIDNFTSIGTNAFAGCSNITKLDFTNSSKYADLSIGMEAFNGCPLNFVAPGGKVVDLSNSNWGTNFHIFGLDTYQPDYSKNRLNLMGCGCMAYGDFMPIGNATSIRSQALSGCAGITSVNFFGLPNLAIIDTESFKSCTSISNKLFIPNYVTFVGQHAFYGCQKSIFNVDAFENYYSWSGVNSKMWCFGGQTSGILSIESGTVAICEYSYDGCTNLLSNNASLPDTLTFIDIGAFGGCSNLSNIKFPQSISINDRAFSGCTQLNPSPNATTITHIGNDAFNGCKNLSVNFLNNLTFTDQNFTKCTDNKLDPTWVAFQKGQDIDFSTSGCLVAGSITAVTASDIATPISWFTPSNISIGYMAFANCASITGINLPTGASFIDDFAFFSCTGLSSINLTNLTSENPFGTHAFDSCVNLVSVAMPNLNTFSIPYVSFENCTNLSDIYFGNQTTSADDIILGDYAFYGCTHTGGTIHAINYATAVAIREKLANGDDPGDDESTRFSTWFVDPSS